MDRYSNKPSRIDDWDAYIAETYPHLAELRKLPLTIQMTQGTHGWYYMIYNGDGSEEGSVVRGGGAYPSAQAAWDDIDDEYKNATREGWKQ